MATQLKILSTSRKRVFDDVPNLSREEGIGFTALDVKTRKITRQMRSDVNKVGFLTQRAYFQAKGRFFNASKFKKEHIQMAIKSLGLKGSIDISTYNPKTASQHKSIILGLYGWRSYKPNDRKILEQQALLLADKQKDSETNLFSLLDYCWKNRIEIPSYNEFTDIISKAYIDFEDTLKKCVSSNITNDQIVSLISIIDNPDIASQFSEIKKINQSTTQRKLNGDAELLIYFKEVFFKIKPLIDELKLTPEAIKHLSGQVHKSTLSQIRAIKDCNKQCLLLSAFVQDQYFLRQDYAVDAFIKSIRSIVNQAKKHNRSLKDKDEKDLNEANKFIIRSKKNLYQVVKLIHDISKNTDISSSERLEKISNLTESFLVSEDPNISDYTGRLETSLENYDLSINLYDFLFKHSSTLQKYFSPIIRNLEFDDKNSNINLLDAIYFFRNQDNITAENIEIKFLNKKENKVISLNNSIPLISKYKVLLFTAIEIAIRRKKLTLNYSYRYKATHTYNISIACFYSNLYI